MCGKTGECKGEMTWVWGKGGFKGITGTTPFVAGIYIQEQNRKRERSTEVPIGRP
jgi:hypothetical protein